MKRFKERYEYTNKDDQYMDVTFEDRVTAQYVLSPNPEWRGNPFIEALPQPWTMDECSLRYTKDILSYDYDAETKIPRYERLEFVKNLTRVRFPLPFVRRLEIELNQALIQSYSKRYQLFDDTLNLIDIYPGLLDGACGKVFADEADSSVSGFAVIGKSGCGKSSALKILLSHYPQVIEHPVTSGRITQITYLVVNCIPNSNFSALYNAIGTAIDRALGFVTPVYEKMISSIQRIGNKAMKIRELIELFAIGIIIFDEIQLINFSGTSSNTYDSLLTLSNMTKVAIGVIGTQDAYEKMFKVLRTARRVGSLIDASEYCATKGTFLRLFKQLSRYQWFDEYIEFDDDFKEALYTYSCGIIDRIISLYIYVHVEYLTKNNIKKVDVELLNNVVKKYFKGLNTLLHKMALNDDENKEIEEIIKKASKEFLEAKMQEQDFETTLSLPEKEQELTDISSMKRKVAQNILNCYPDADYEKINDAFDKIYKKGKELTEAEFTNRVVTKLFANSKKTKTKKQSGTIPIESMINSLQHSI